MLLMIVLTTVLINNALASDELLDSLSGIHGGNNVILCMEPGREKDECRGVIWQRIWVLVKGSCVAEKAMYPVIVLRTSPVACDSIATDGEVSGSRKVRARFLHPPYPTTDVALLRLDRPYDMPDPLRNDSHFAMYRLEPWLMDVVSQYTPTTPRAKYNTKMMNMFSTPIKMFLTTVVLPLTSFIVFFLFITFFTGSNKNTVQYKSLDNDKEDSNFA